jgi:hypothetical protein
MDKGPVVDGPEAKNPREELAQWARDNPPLYGRKLSFPEKCGIAYALRSKGVTHDNVRDAFNLSRATVSLLAGALNPEGTRYRDVWNAFYELGEEAFGEKYYNPLHMRFKRVRLQLTHLTEGQDVAPKQSGPDPRARKYAGLHTLPDNSRWMIDELVNAPPLPRGWYFALTDGDEMIWHGEERVRGANGHEPFRTSADAFDGLYEINGYADQNPRPKPGRPRKK